jgi:hypothetical protein
VLRLPLRGGRQALPQQLEDRRVLPLRLGEVRRRVVPPLVEPRPEAGRSGDVPVAPLAETVRCPRVTKKSRSGAAEALT